MSIVPPIVSTEWLAEHLGDPNARVVDIRGSVSTRLVAEGVEEATYQGAPEDYQAGHIPGSVFVDWTADIIDPADPVPAQLAPPDRFAAVMGRLGIGDDTHVVAVDHQGGQFATRLWWALRYYGHDAASVLEGGFARWVDEGRPITDEPTRVEPAAFHPKPRPELRATVEDVLQAVHAGDATLLDARPTAQFTGERRRGPRGGHIPGAVSLPKATLFDDQGRFLEPERVKARLADLGIGPETPVITYCNGGVAASVVAFQLSRLGFERVRLYDGSWNEWGRREDLPAEPGA